MITITIHFMIGILKRFFLGIGGIARWLIFQAYNALYSEKYPTNLDYYIDNKNRKLDKNGFSTQNKNFISGAFVFIFIILILEQFENK